jgi:hypothetical protein
MAAVVKGLTTEPDLHLYLVQDDPSLQVLAVLQAGATPDWEAYGQQPSVTTPVLVRYYQARER